ncbi:MAG TPA: hypothetical protein VFI69_06230 [Candidatus Limnocylindrales bacterium]|jgi:hypothetical protein|nr:hypothetical protein [Candidatus Limnocylindrales bacterium]
MTGTQESTVGDAIDRSLDAYARLTELGESVEDEWSYVNDLTTAWRDRLDAVAAARATESLPPAVVVAIDLAIDQIARIDDPHRAIDWLSTFPQVVLVALGEAS